MGFRLAYLDLTLAHILTVKVKVKHLLTGNISKMVKDWARITSAINYDVVYKRSIDLDPF